MVKNLMKTFCCVTALSASVLAQRDLEALPQDFSTISSGTLSISNTGTITGVISGTANTDPIIGITTGAKTGTVTFYNVGAITAGAITATGSTDLNAVLKVRETSSITLCTENHTVLASGVGGKIRGGKGRLEINNSDGGRFSFYSIQCSAGGEGLYVTNESGTLTGDIYFNECPGAVKNSDQIIGNIFLNPQASYSQLAGGSMKTAIYCSTDSFVYKWDESTEIAQQGAVIWLKNNQLIKPPAHMALEVRCQNPGEAMQKKALKED